MSTILGLISKKNISNPEMNKIFESWTKDISTSQKPNVWLSNNIGFGHQLLAVTPESVNEKQPYYDAKIDCCIIADSRLDYREGLLLELGLNLSTSKHLMDCQIILEAYLKWGKGCTNKLHGDFSFAIWDNRAQELFCARDHFGCRPFFFLDNEEYLVFSTDINAITSLPFVEGRITNSWILDMLVFVIPEKWRSPYENIYRLPPAHQMIFSNNLIVKERYWTLERRHIDIPLTIEEAAQMFNKLAHEALRNRFRSISNIGVEFSGGLDSSGIAAMSEQIKRNDTSKIFAFTHSWPSNANAILKSSIEELEMCSSFAENLKFDSHELISGSKKGVLTAIEKSLNQQLAISLDGYSMMSDLLYERAKELGVKVLISGYGGDEGVSMNAGVLLDELAIKKEFGQLKREIAKLYGIKNLRLWRVYLYYMTLSLSPVLLSFYRSLFKSNFLKKKRFNMFALNNGIINKRVAYKRYLDKTKPLISRTVNNRQMERMQSDYIPIRLENTYAAAQKNEMEVVYPFLDIKLVEFYYNLPSQYKYKDGVGRYLYRLSMEELIPKDILGRNDKTVMSVPNVNYRLKYDINEIRSLLQESEVKNSYHYVDYTKLNLMLDQLLNESMESRSYIVPNVLFNYLKLLILQKWQREGKIDIGIKC